MALFLFWTVWGAAAITVAPVSDVQVDGALALGEGESRILVLTVSNNGVQAVEDVTIECLNKGKLVCRHQVDLLEPNQHIAFIVEGLGKTDSSPYVYVQFRTANGTESIARVVSASSAANPGSGLVAFIPALIGLIGVAVGAMLVHWFTSAREKRQREYDWGKAQHDKYGSAYVDFVNSWGGVASEEILRRTFRELTNRAPVPPVIMAAYNAAVQVLLSPTANADDKSRACSYLEDQVQVLILSPWRSDMITINAAPDDSD